MNIVVYTAVTNGKDKVRMPKPKFSGVKYVLYTDVNGYYPRWDEVRPIGNFTDDKRYAARRTAKMPKILSTLHHPDAEWTIWMDGSHTCAVHPQEIIEEFLSKEKKLWASFSHPTRNCVYQEAEALAQLPWIEHSTKMTEQMEYYKLQGMPKNFGLPANTVLVRHNCSTVAILEAAWWEQICRFSSRDQLSLPYCMWKLDFWPYLNTIPGHWQRNDYIPMAAQHAKVEL